MSKSYSGKLNQGRDKTAFITAVTIIKSKISLSQENGLIQKWSDQEVVCLPVDLQEIDALSLSESDDAIFQNIANM
ncbi:hypothetical protein HI855_10160 [Cyanobacteria bacterium 150NLHA]|uniref:hypothetical protein n=1 Tax=Prochlorococcus TaxID=1218 RepID=UPI0007B3B4C8|nr:MULTISPECIES: hypothetical protein [Prochlorococcus]NMO83409.1 hypothetical protein [Prochlorococcus sp. P1344]NMP06918.1 hypothetical protein [Prochlorococcus sp. P1361]NMP12630.1 hypothetical protein [Prochlorococcus sp.P1363]